MLVDSSPATSVSVAVLPAAPAQWCSESDPGGSSLLTVACCLLQSSASDVPPGDTGFYRNISNRKSEMTKLECDFKACDPVGMADG